VDVDLTMNVIAPAVLLDVLAAFGTGFAVPLDGGERGLLGFGLLAGLVCGARLAFVGGSVAACAGGCAAGGADADVGWRVVGLVRLCSRADRFDRVCCCWFVHLAGFASRIQAPPPPWGLVGDATPLQLGEALVDGQGRVPLHVGVAHQGGALRTGELVVRPGLETGGDPLPSAVAAGINAVLTVVRHEVVREGGAGQVAPARGTIVPWPLGLGCYLRCLADTCPSVLVRAAGCCVQTC